MSRPEHQAPPELFYGENEARKYTSNSRIQEIQAQITERALELLNLQQENCYILDIGCGSGLSGTQISEEGHIWVGVDISPSMIETALEREVSGDLLLQDMGQGLPFRSGIFDGAISISAVQWLCNADQSSHDPRKRLTKFFQSLYAVLRRGARAVLQFYPENAEQLELITTSAMKVGFSGGVVIDYPNSTRAKKYYLCLFAGMDNRVQLPKALGAEDEEKEEETVKYAERRHAKRRTKQPRRAIKDRNWVVAKKERQRKQGRDVRPDSKFTARRRKDQF